MANDIRQSRSLMSGFARIQSGDNGDYQVIELRESETVSPNYVKIHYASGGTTDTELVLYNKKSSADDELADPEMDAFLLSPGDNIIIEEATYDDASRGIIAATDGNNDDEIIVTVGGVKVTG